MQLRTPTGKLLGTQAASELRRASWEAAYGAGQLHELDWPAGTYISCNVGAGQLHYFPSSSESFASTSCKNPTSVSSTSCHSPVI